MTPIEASKKVNAKIVYNNLKDKREVQKLKINLGDLLRTAYIKRVLSKGDSTIWSNKLYTNTENIHDTILSYRGEFLPERYIKNLLISTNINLDENFEVMKELNLIQ